MRVCDRCRSEDDPAECRLLLNAQGGRARLGARLDLCRACRETMTHLINVPGLAAADMLRVLDGDPPAAVVEAAEKAQEAGEEIPFEVGWPPTWSAAARRYFMGLYKVAHVAKDHAVRATDAYQSAMDRGADRRNASLEGAAALPKNTYGDGVKRMLTAKLGAPEWTGEV